MWFFWGPPLYSLPFFLFLRFYLFIFRERGREGEREGEKHQCVVASHVVPTGDLAHTPVMRPDWESDWWPFGLQLALSPLSLTNQGFSTIFTELKLLFRVSWLGFRTWVLVQPVNVFQWWNKQIILIWVCFFHYEMVMIVPNKPTIPIRKTQVRYWMWKCIL